MDNPIRPSVSATMTVRNIFIPTLVFVTLIALTLLSSLGAEARFFSQTGAAKFIIGAAMIKTALVLYVFMGIRSAHMIVRVLVLLWTIGLGAVLIFYALTVS